MNAPAPVHSQTVSPAAGNINEVLKNVAAMNNKIGGRRKTRKHGKKQTRKNHRARTARHMKGRGLPTDYTDCKHLYQEKHDKPSLLIEIEKPKINAPGPAKPWRWYDCKEVKPEGEDFVIGYKGRSCQNKRYDNQLVMKDKVKKTQQAWTTEEIEEWCCPRK